MSFLYFLPNERVSSVTESILQRFGLTHIRDHVTQAVHFRDVVANGPGGQPGAVIGVADCWEAEEVKQSDAIEWVKFPKSHAQSQAWLGWKKGELPKPESLRRADGTIPGDMIRLADGELWEVPIARDVTGSCLLPRAFDLDEETGEWVSSRVRREYTKLWEHALGYYTNKAAAYIEAQASGVDKYAFEIPDGERLVADALAVNYRVSMRELATLGVLVTGIVQDVAEILIDHHDNVKKKLASGTGSEPNG